MLQLDINILKIICKKAETASEPETPAHNPLDESKPAEESVYHNALDDSEPEEKILYHRVTPLGLGRGKQLPLLSMTETKAQEEEEDDKEDEDNDSNDSSSDSESNDESSDSSDSEGDQNDELPSPEDKEDDIDRGHPDLSSDDEDSDDDCIPTLPTNLLQELENNEMFSDAIAPVQQPTPPNTPPQDATLAPKTSVTEPPIQELPKDSNLSR